MKVDEFKDAKILVVDDEKHNRDLVKFFLSQAGYDNFLEASTVPEAIDLAFKNLPDIIFLDIQLEDETGFDVCKALKEDDSTKNIPILFLSAYSETENKVTGYKLGAVDFVNKPINHYELMARTRVHLKNGQMVKQLQAYQSRINHELEKAKKTQNSIMPSAIQIDDLQEKYNVQIETIFKSSSELAGDYWKVTALDDDNIMVIVADFSGHGVYSALNTVRLDLLVAQSNMETLLRPRRAIKELNTALYESLPSDEFCAMVYMVINTKTGKAEYVASNSPDLYVLKADASEPIALKGQGFPLGLTKKLEDTDFTHKIVHLEVGDMIIGYSDALTEEPHTTGARWLDEGFLDVLKETQEYSKTNKENTRFEYIYNKFDETVVKPLTDDLTFVGITRK